MNETIITEDYVSFEIAKLLKEKGFPIPSFNFKDWMFCMYDEDGKIQWGCYDPAWYARITLQMAMTWIREAHNIHIAIVPCEIGPGVMDYTYILYKVDPKNRSFKYLEIQGRAETDKMSVPKTCEAGIKCCLEKLIEA